MRRLIGCLPFLNAKYWSVSAWSFNVEENLETLHGEIVPHMRLSKMLRHFQFVLLIHIFYLFKRMRGFDPAECVIHTLTSNCYFADVATFNFHQKSWIEAQLKLRPSSFSEWAELLHAGVMCVFEYIQLKNPLVLCYIAPSIRTAEALSKTVKDPTNRVRVLPNSIDIEYYAGFEKGAYRDAIRDRFGFSTDTVVLSFCCHGHFRRKGFWIALEALSILRSKYNMNVSLLVVGGTPKTLRSIQQRMRDTFPKIIEAITFVGNVADVRPYLSASDAFFFPSYFEALSTAVLEAAAMDLPLLLTPHPGAEMVLTDGLNGKLLPYDPETMAQDISEYFKSQITRFQSSRAKLLDIKDYAEQLNLIYEEVLNIKLKNRPI